MDWKCISRINTSQKTTLHGVECPDHPLKHLTQINDPLKSRKVSVERIPATSLNLALDGTDPLSQFARLDEITSPLSENFEEKSASVTAQGPNPKFQVWATKRPAILNKYTTSEKLSIVTSFLTGGEIIKSSTTTVSEKVKHRLEQLDDFDEDPVRQMHNLSQHEYIMKIEQLNHQLRDAWNTDQRVKALKIAIQCAKLLADTSAMQFYPSKFVLITDILDLFGSLVYDRLKNKALYVRPGSTKASKLPDDFTPEMIPEATKETSFNWFYKVASIRELLPRFYVEAAIVRSYKFMGNADIEGVLNRLTLIARGIGDPLVSAYARCYLCRVGMQITSAKPYLRQNFEDILSVYLTMFTGGIRAEIARQRISVGTYVTLYAPAFDWILTGIAAGADDFTMDELVLRCQEKKNCAPLFYSILQAFPHKFVSVRALHFANILCKCDTEGYSRAELLRGLGMCLVDCPPEANQLYDVFEFVWKTVQTFTQIGEYVHCMEAWAIYVAANLMLGEVNIILEDILRRAASQKNAFEAHYTELQSIIDKIVTNFPQFDALLTLDNFLPVIDLFQKESNKQAVCRNILTQFKTYSESVGYLSDPVIINVIMHISKILNDSVNALTVDDEKRQIGEAVNFFIRLVNFGTDFEQQLTFYNDARAAFTNLDVVYVTLVQLVDNLAMETYRIVNGKHSRKTGDFVKSCIAYNFVTIPSITDVRYQLDLYLLTGQIALLNNCLGQADACFEAALKSIAELPKHIDFDGKPKSTEPYLVSYLKNFLSMLIIAPDSPEMGALYLFRLLTEQVQTYGFEISALIEIYLAVLDTLSIMSQETYPFHVANVISNDKLYGQDQKYLNEINKICTNVTSQILLSLKALADAGNFRVQANFALQLFEKIVLYSDIADDRAFQLAVNLWNLAVKQRANVKQGEFEKYLKRVEDEIELADGNQRKVKLTELFNRIKAKL
ncbi:VPS35 endosomal protein sorting factor-like isoform X2 [Culicoides brevitarsis]|uniref:VPS35 endosomal protein sorting factor-like isoform X2 n=1 Tax=Culicoides brevitarsis TaxID=469753 RepID=UPI00307C396D